MTQKIAEKLANKTPPVTIEEIEQCFANRVGRFILDSREIHASDPRLGGSSQKRMLGVV